jgi:hypothetical protein
MMLADVRCGMILKVRQQSDLDGIQISFTSTVISINKQPYDAEEPYVFPDQWLFSFSNGVDLRGMWEGTELARVEDVW